MTSSVSALFFLLSEHGRRVTENELRAQIDQYRTQLQNDAEYEGGIEIQAPGLQPFVVEDSLPALAKNLCFLAIPDLIENRSVVYHCHNHYGNIQLNPEANVIHIIGEDNAPLYVPQDIFLKSIYECGLRFIQLLELAQGSMPNPDVASLIAFLNQHRTVAQAALER